MADLREFHRLLDEVAQDMVPADLRAAGWRYVDIPGKLSPEMWEHFLSILGEGNYQLVTYSEGDNWKRGQFFMSPKAFENMRAHEHRPVPME